MCARIGGFLRCVCAAEGVVCPSARQREDERYQDDRCKEQAMWDLLIVAITVVFFAVAMLYIRACAHLR